MRIAYMFYDYPGYCGGPMIFARRLLPELHRRGHEVIAMIMYHQGGSPAADYLREQGVRCCITPWVDNTERQIQWVLAQVGKLNPDVFMPYISVSGSFAARWVREAGIPTIMGYLSSDAFSWGMVEQFVTGPEEWAVSGLACVSDELCRRVEEMNPPRTQLRAIPFGISLPENVATQQGPLRLVYAGRLEERYKRIGDLVEALCMVIRARPEISAKIVGSGQERSRLEKKVAQEGFQDRIKFTGVVESHQIHEHLLDQHVLVLLSDLEGQPGAVIDGMACGLVPVCLDIPAGLRELVIHEETGLLVEDRQKSFLAAITRLADDNALRRRLAENARAHISAHYSLCIAADRWERFCDELIAGANPRRSISIPRHFGLPPVHPRLASEDIRRKPVWSRATTFCARKAKGASRRLFHTIAGQ